VIGSTGFGVYDSNAAINRYVTVWRNGNVGISNANPLENLHVGGKVYSETQFINNSNDSTAAPAFSFREDSNTGMYHASNQTLGFTTAGSERVRIGNTGVGINTTLAPTCILDVNGNICAKSTTTPEMRLINSNNMAQCIIACATSAAQYSTGSASNDLVIRADHATARVHIQTSNQAAAITVNSNNFVGINITNPTYRLHVNGEVFATGDIMAFSDCNLKTDLRPITNAVDKVVSLNGYTFKRIDQDADQQRQAGLLAQEVQRILPEVVHQDPSTSNLSIAYGNLAALFVEAFKEMKQEIQTLRALLNSRSHV
jgi:hypothetical protein